MLSKEKKKNSGGNLRIEVLLASSEFIGVTLVDELQYQREKR